MMVPYLQSSCPQYSRTFIFGHVLGGNLIQELETLCSYNILSPFALLRLLTSLLWLKNLERVNKESSQTGDHLHITVLHFCFDWI